MPYCPGCRQEMSRITEGGHRTKGRHHGRSWEGERGPESRVARIRQQFFCAGCNIVLSSDLRGEVRLTEYTPGGDERPKHLWWGDQPPCTAVAPTHSRPLQPA